MKTKYFWLAAFLSLLLSGCAGKAHVIGYDIIKSPLPSAQLGKIYISPFKDGRPKEEREGVKGKVLTFSSKDAHFRQEVSQAIEEILAEELSNVGFTVVKERPNYSISGEVLHFQAIMSPSKITFLPYLGALSTLWAKDEFTIALSISIKMADQRNNVLIDKTFNVSEDMKLSTGLLNLARYSRGFNYKLKLMDEALKDVIGQIRDEVLVRVKK